MAVRYHAVTCTDTECCPSCPIGDPTVQGGEGDRVSDLHIRWDGDEPPATPALPAKGDLLPIYLGDGRILYTIVSETLASVDGNGGTIRVIGDPHD